MKGYKVLVPLGLAVCLALSVYMLFSTRMETAKEYDNCLKDARYYAELNIGVDALKNYNKALDINPTVDIYLEVGNFLLKVKDQQAAVAWGEKMVEKFPDDASAYEYLLSRYRENNDFHRCYALYNTIVKREVSTQAIETIMNDIRYVFYLGEAYDEVSVYSHGYCAVRYEEKWGLVNETGRRVTPFEFKEIGPFFDDLAPVCSQAGERFFIDNKGNKKFVAQVDGKVEKLTSVVDNVFAVYDGTVWNFYTREFEKLGGGYSDISLMANGVVGVKQNSQWTVLNHRLESTTGKSYVDLVQDDRGIIYRNGIMFVNQDGGYYMVDINGQTITNEKFLNAKLFMDNTYAAVETANGWTFVDATGKKVFENLYFDDARSFVNGFAAVQKFGKWGYIDMNGEVVIDYQFREVRDFNTRGCAFVQYEDIWEMLMLYSKNYDV